MEKKEERCQKKKIKLVEPNQYWRMLEMESKYIRDY